MLHRRWFSGALVVLVYAMLGLAALWDSLPGEASRIPRCSCGDPVLSTWFLEWVPFALLHGHNPLFTSLINVPSGVNLAQNTMMPLLGLLVSPVTLLAGPLSSYTLLLYLAFPLSAASMFFVLRYWTGSDIAASVGGLIYGFSTFSTGQGIDHPMFSFVPLPPLIALLSYELLIRQANGPYRHGLLLGLLVIGQFFIEPEVLADLAIVLALGLLVLVAARWRSIAASRVGHALKGFSFAAVVTGAVVAYPVWFMEFGRQHFVGTVQPISNPYRSDLLGPVVPTMLEHFDPSWLSSLGETITHEGIVQNDTYIGLPLLLLAAFVTLYLRHNPWINLSAALAAAAFVLSLGPKLVVDGHQTSIPLPFALLAKLPLVGNILPARLSLLVALFVAVVVSLGCADLLRPPRVAHSVKGVEARRTSAHLKLTAFVVGVATACLLPLLPSWPYGKKPVDVPAFFTSSDLERIPSGSVVLTYPFALYPYDQAMLWQAVAGMRFRLLGGYALQRNQQGRAALSPSGLSPSVVAEFLERAEEGSAGDLVSSPLREKDSANVEQFLRNYDVSTVIVSPGIDNAGIVTTMFSEALGPPLVVGGVAAWFNLSRG